MKRYLLFLAIVPWTFIAGFIYTYMNETKHNERLEITKQLVNLADTNLKTVEQFYKASVGATMLERPERPNDVKLFHKNEHVTCIYDAIRSWGDGNEFIEPIPMKCIVIEASEVWNDLEPNYQHVHVDCTKDLEKKWTNKPGIGLVKNHKLNYKTRWYSSNDCYHFITD